MTLKTTPNIDKLMCEHTIMQPFKPLTSFTVELRGLAILKDLVSQFNGGRGLR